MRDIDQISLILIRSAILRFLTNFACVRAHEYIIRNQWNINQNYLIIRCFFKLWEENKIWRKRWEDGKKSRERAKEGQRKVSKQLIKKTHKSWSLLWEALLYKYEYITDVMIAKKCHFMQIALKYSTAECCKLATTECLLISEWQIVAIYYIVWWEKFSDWFKYSINYWKIIGWLMAKSSTAQILVHAFFPMRTWNTF